MLTIEDIAKKTGLSIATVSRYYNGIKIREENKKILDKITEETGYKPNDYASTLKGKKTKIIGALIPTIQDNFAMSVLSEIEVELKKHGYSLLITDHMLSEKMELDCLNTLIQKRVNGIVLLPYTPFTNIDKIIDLSKQNNIPIVIFDMKIDDVNTEYVLFDNYGAGFTACEKLINSGHTEIGIITAPNNLYTARERLKGYIRCLDQYHITTKNNYIYTAKTFSFESGYECAVNMIKSGNLPTALITTNYDITLGTIKALNEYKIKIPDDISLIALDYSNLYQVITPSLTAIKQPTNIIGKEITSSIISKINNEYKNNEIKIVSYELIEGNSIKIN